MFTGIVQEMAHIKEIDDHDGIRTFDIEFPEGFCEGLNIGASVAVDGVCLTVTQILSPTRATFDVILQSMRITTLGLHEVYREVNVERAAKDGAEIGGHPLSGHVDFKSEIIEITEMDGNCRLRFACDQKWSKYLFPKGYVAINGCSLTLSEVDKQQGYFEVWLIPETRRVTSFDLKQVGGWVNVEIERGTQVIVDTIENTLEQKLGALYPMLEAMMAEKKLDLGHALTNELNLLNKKND